MKFTPEEISLCKKIAAKHEGEVEVGDWLDFENGLYLVTEIVKTPEKVDVYVTDFRVAISADDDFIPLWTISDCLEVLREKCQDHVLLIHDKEDEVEWFLWMDEYKKTQQMGRGKTPLEACLKAVLAVLEDKDSPDDGVDRR